MPGSSMASSASPDGMRTLGLSVSLCTREDSESGISTPRLTSALLYQRTAVLHQRKRICALSGLPNNGVSLSSNYGSWYWFSVCCVCVFPFVSRLFVSAHFSLPPSITRPGYPLYVATMTLASFPLHANTARCCSSPFSIRCIEA